MMEKLKHHHRIVSYIKHELISHELFHGITLYFGGNHLSYYLEVCLYI